MVTGAIFFHERDEVPAQTLRDHKVLRLTDERRASADRRTDCTVNLQNTGRVDERSVQQCTVVTS